MRRTLILAFLLTAVPIVSAAGSPGQPAKSHRKATSSPRRGIRPSNSETASRAGSRKKSKQAGQRTKLRLATTDAVRNVRYTPERAQMGTSAATGLSSSYAAGYRNGYEAGRAATLRQLANQNADVVLDEHNSDAAKAGAEPAKMAGASGTERPAAHEASDRLAADRTSHDPGLSPAPVLSETTETDTPGTPPLDEVASVHMSGAGMLRPLRGSLASLERQNARTDDDGLERIEDDADLANRIEHKLLVPLPASAALNVNPALPDHNRYCRPWTARFLADLARAHEAAFHRPIQVNSAVRTVEYQKRLMRTNGNAAAAEGDIVSPHLTGATVDIGKSGLSRPEIVWMRRQLLGLQQAGRIDVEEEFAQACFHITVYKSYVSPTGPEMNVPPRTSHAATRRKASRPASQEPAGHLPADPPVGESPAQGR